METQKTNVDVCIISNAKTTELYYTTMIGIESLLKSEEHIHFNIFLVESNQSAIYNPEYIKTIYTTESFNYNKYLNIAVKEGKSEYVVLCNSDLTYDKYWASNIINAMKIDRLLLSASPFCPQTQDETHWNPYNIYYGKRIRVEIAGWCIFQKRKIYDIIGKLNEDVEFWYSDNIYADQLIKHNVVHALVPSSIVNHHSNNLGITGSSILSKKEKSDYTVGQYEKYEKAREKLFKN